MNMTSDTIHANVSTVTRMCPIPIILSVVYFKQYVYLQFTFVTDVKDKLYLRLTPL